MKDNCNYNYYKSSNTFVIGYYVGNVLHGYNNTRFSNSWITDNFRVVQYETYKSQFDTILSNHSELSELSEFLKLIRNSDFEERFDKIVFDNMTFSKYDIKILEKHKQNKVTITLAIGSVIKEKTIHCSEEVYKRLNDIYCSTNNTGNL